MSYPVLKMTKLNLKIGDKINNLSSNKTYEKVTEIKIINGIVVIWTKEYYKTTDSLVSDCIIKWNLTHLKSKIRSNEDIEIKK